MDQNLTYAYLAGAMDSDGYFTIKRSTYHKRVREDAINALYQERCGLKQVTPDIPSLLKETFGGSLYKEKPGTENSKPLWVYSATDRIAANICNALLPFLIVKKEQAKLLMVLRETKNNTDYLQHAYWFAIENPDWEQMEMMTTTDAAKALRYKSNASVSQAIRLGSLLAIDAYAYRSEAPRICKPLVDLIVNSGGPKAMPTKLVEWRHSLYESIRELNKIGVNGTPVYHRTDFYVPAG
jgi:hypothetical protein